MSRSTDGKRNVPRSGEVRARVGRVLRLREVVHADVDPRDQVLLGDVLAVEELVEVDHRGTGKVQVPLGTRSGLRLLALRHREVVPGPVRVLKQTLRTYDRLQGRMVR